MQTRMSRFHESKYRRRGLPLLSQSEALRPRLRHKNAGVPGIVDAHTQKLRDVYKAVAATPVTVQTLFSIPVGQQYTPAGGTAYVKTRWDTNLTQGGQLAAPRRFLVQGISCSNHNNIAASDFNNMAFQTLVSLWIDEKRWIELLLQQIPGGGGAFAGGQVFQATAANASYTSINNGWPSSRSIFTMENDNTWIELLQNFSLVLDPTLYSSGAFTTAAAAGTTFGQGVNLQAQLEGLLVGPVL